MICSRTCSGSAHSARAGFACGGRSLGCEGRSDSSFCNNNETSRYGFLIFFKQVLKYRYFVFSSLIFKTQKYHTFMRLILTKNKLSKIFVICYQYAILLEGLWITSLSSAPLISSYTEITSLFCRRNQCATAGPVHSSTQEPHLTSLCCQRHKCGIFKRFCCE